MAIVRCEGRSGPLPGRSAQLEDWTNGIGKYHLLCYPSFVQADCDVPPIQRIDFGTQQVEVVPWGDAHILVTPADAVSPQSLHLYSLSASNPNRPLLTLQLPQIDLNPGETLHGVKMTTSLHPPAPGGHFRADPEKSMLVLTHQVLPEDSHPDNMDIRSSSHVLIPYATLRRQLDAVTIESDSADRESSEPPAPIPWQDWGSRTSLRLRVRPERELGADLDDLVTSIPLGSRLPLVCSTAPHAPARPCTCSTSTHSPRGTRAV